MHFPSSPQPRPLSLSLSLPKKNINPPPFHTQATAALERQEVPIGCVLVDESGRVVAKGSNRTNEKRDVRVCAFFSFWFSSLPSFLSSLFSFVFFLSHTPPLAKKLKKKKNENRRPATPSSRPSTRCGPRTPGGRRATRQSSSGTAGAAAAGEEEEEESKATAAAAREKEDDSKETTAITRRAPLSRALLCGISPSTSPASPA